MGFPEFLVLNIFYAAPVERSSLMLNHLIDMSNLWD